MNTTSKHLTTDLTTLPHILIICMYLFEKCYCFSFPGFGVKTACNPTFSFNKKPEDQNTAPKPTAPNIMFSGFGATKTSNSGNTGNSSPEETQKVCVC